MTNTNSPEFWINDFPWPKSTDHKYSRGHVCVLGGQDMTGAPRLAAKASRRIGAGMTTLLCPKAAQPLYQTTLLGTIVQPYESLDDVETFLKTKQIKAILIGPGLLPTHETRQLVDTCLKTGLPVILDAGALSCYKVQTQDFFERLNVNCILLPHDGEFKRLFELDEDRISCTKKASYKVNCTVLLKGSDTIIANPHSDPIINKDAPATLATAGSGDVLAGMIAGLVAQGLKAETAGAIACWVQREAANTFGPGLIAEDLIDLIPGVLGKLEQDSKK